MLISAHQCSSVLISTHLPLRSAMPRRKRCSTNSDAFGPLPRGRGDGRDSREDVEELQSSAIKRNQAQSREIAPAEGEAMTGTHGIRSRRHTLCREAKRRPVRRAEITYHPLARHGASELRMSGRDGLISGERDRVARGASDGHYGAIGR